MIQGQSTVIRTAEPDDAGFLLDVYRVGLPRAALLDPRREPMMPTREELEEMLCSKEMERGQFFAVEDLDGNVRGFCGIRGVSIEAVFGELMVLLLDTESHSGDIGREAIKFLLDRAFNRMHLQKALGTCLDTEPELRKLFSDNGFVSEGVQRQLLYSGGQWHDLETMTHFQELP